MNVYVFGLLAIAGGFLAGSIPFGVIVSRLFFGRDIRAEGSGNIGAANALRTLGKAGAVAVLALDALKGAIPVLAVNLLGGPAEIAALGGLAAVFGHCYSPFLGGKGGKGVATSYGAILALAWPAGVAFTLVWIAVVIACGYASVASMLAGVAMPFALWFMLGRPGLVYGIASALFIVFTHRENLGRLRAGTENSLPLFAKRSATR
ncbi:MAG: glycerol-3-phosphate 1-O-acyltransferase PlsY [Candidatus Velthaea sp.]